MSVLVLVSSSRFSFRFFTGVFSRKVHFRSIDWHRSIDRSIDRNFVSNNEERDEGRRSIPRVSPRGVARENSRIGGIRIGESGSVFFFFWKIPRYAAVNEGLIVYSWALLLTWQVSSDIAKQIRYIGYSKLFLFFFFKKGVVYVNRTMEKKNEAWEKKNWWESCARKIWKIDKSGEEWANANERRVRLNESSKICSKILGWTGIETWSNGRVIFSEQCWESERESEWGEKVSWQVLTRFFFRTSL